MIYLLVVPLYAPPKLDLGESGEASGLVDKFVPGINKVSLGSGSQSGGGFTIVGTSSEMSTQESNLLRTHMELFDILSNNTEIDHPLCDECCDTLITLLDTELRDAEEESNQYAAFLKKYDFGWNFMRLWQF
jgi:beclin 1